MPCFATHGPSTIPTNLANFGCTRCSTPASLVLIAAQFAGEASVIRDATLQGNPPTDRYLPQFGTGIGRWERIGLRQVAVQQRLESIRQGCRSSSEGDSASGLTNLRRHTAAVAVKTGCEASATAGAVRSWRIRRHRAAGSPGPLFTGSGCHAGGPSAKQSFPAGLLLFRAERWCPPAAVLPVPEPGRRSGRGNRLVEAIRLCLCVSVSGLLREGGAQVAFAGGGADRHDGFPGVGGVRGQGQGCPDVCPG